MRALALLLCALPACIDAADPGPPPAGTEAVYVLGDGDTVAAIARRFAVPGGWRALAAANHLLDPDHVVAGTGLVIPIEGLVAQGHDPFSLYDDVELVPRLPPIELPRPPAAPADDDWPLDDAPVDGCGGRHTRFPVDPDALTVEAGPRCAPVAGHRLCVGDRGDAYDDDGLGVAVTVDDQPWLTLPYGLWTPLEVVEVDLDRDGRDELVLAELTAVSNGAAIPTYDVAVAPAPGAPAHRFSTNGWALAADGDGCALTSQTFEAIDDPIEGSGNYDVVRALVWQDGMLATRGDRIRAQRWSDRPPQLRQEPLLAGQVLARRAGTVVGFDDRPDAHRALTLDLGGEQVTLGERTWAWSDDEDEPDPESQYDGWGWQGAQVLLPADLRPPPASLIGRDALVETRLTWPAGTVSQVVWLTP